MAMMAVLIAYIFAEVDMNDEIKMIEVLQKIVHLGY